MRPIQIEASLFVLRRDTVCPSAELRKSYNDFAIPPFSGLAFLEKHGNCIVEKVCVDVKTGIIQCLMKHMIVENKSEFDQAVAHKLKDGWEEKPDADGTDAGE